MYKGYVIRDYKHSAMRVWNTSYTENEQDLVGND